MAPSSKRRQSEGDKGQRSISSFFAAKQPSPAASAGQPGPDQPRPKRQRTSDGDQPHVTQQLNQAPPVQAAPKVAPISGTPAPDKRAIETEQQHEPDPAGIPARQDARHQRFQNKLVIGRGNSKRDTAAPADVGAAKPKYTPLELQIVALKREHPNVLLIVEVGCVRAPLAAHSPLVNKHYVPVLLHGTRVPEVGGVWSGGQELCDSCLAGISSASLARMQRLQLESATFLRTQVCQAGWVKLGSASAASSA